MSEEDKKKKSDNELDNICNNETESDDQAKKKCSDETIHSNHTIVGISDSYKNTLAHFEGLKKTMTYVAENARKFQSSIQNNEMARVMKLRMEQAKVFSDVRSKILGNMMPLIRNVAAMHARMSEIKVSLEEVSKYQRLLINIYRRGDINQRFSLALVVLKWTPPRDIRYSAIKKIVTIFENEDLQSASKKIDEILLNYYSDDEILSTLKGWRGKEFLHKRIGILEDIIDAHLQGKYNLSIPAILPQIEGVIADVNYHKGRMQGKQLKKYMNKRLKDAEDFYYSGAFKNYLTDIVYAQFEHGEKVESPLSRNAILHGADVFYGNKKNSLNAILMFDYMQSLFELVSLKHSRVYHRVGCRRLNNHKRELIYYNNSDEVEKDKKHACKLCKP